MQWFRLKEHRSLLSSYPELSCSVSTRSTTESRIESIITTKIVLIIDDVTTISIELTETSAAVCMQSALVFLVPQRCCA